MSAIAYVENGHGISLTDFPEHYIMVFGLTSTQEATHDFIHPELTNSSLNSEQLYQTTLKYYSWEKNVQQYTSILRETFPKTHFL